MGFKFLDKNGEEVDCKDVQDKDYWCKLGEVEEIEFIKKNGLELGLIINPEKTNDKYSPDLFDINRGIRADLKYCKTPFFLSESKYNMDSQNTVVFDKKDQLRYLEKYPEIDIYFDINWKTVAMVGSYKTFKVFPMVGTWRIPFKTLNTLLNSAPLHIYKNRVHDNKGNGKSAYLLNILSPEFEMVLG